MPQTFFDQLFPGGRRGNPFGGGGGTGTQDPAPGSYQGEFVAGQITPGSEADLIEQAEGVRRQEENRYTQGVDLASQAYRQSQAALSQGVDADLLFSRASDAVGARSREGMAALRRSLGGRGINPNSGAAGGLLSRLLFERQGALVGARRDIALENQRARQQNAAVNFANAMNLAGLITQDPSAVRLDAATTLFEGQIAREGIAAQRRASKDASKSNLIGGLIGAGASILGGLI